MPELIASSTTPFTISAKLRPLPALVSAVTPPLAALV